MKVYKMGFLILVISVLSEVLNNIRYMNGYTITGETILIFGFDVPLNIGSVIIWTLSVLPEFMIAFSILASTQQRSNSKLNDFALLLIILTSISGIRYLVRNYLLDNNPDGLGSILDLFILISLVLTLIMINLLLRLKGIHLNKLKLGYMLSISLLDLEMAYLLYFFLGFDANILHILYSIGLLSYLYAFYYLGKYLDEERKHFISIGDFSYFPH